MVFTAPIFWHPGQHPQPHQLPDARSDPKGRTLLRRMRYGYAAMSDEAMPEPGPQHADDPPEYDMQGLAQDLPPALPGYTPLPDTAPQPGPGKGQDPEPRQRRRYLYVLRRSLSSTRQKLNRGSARPADEDAVSSAGSERGVVMYQRDNQWVDIGEAGLGAPEARPRTLKGWVRKIWNAIKEFSKEHPALFIVAVFFIIIVAICVLI